MTLKLTVPKGSEFFKTLQRKRSIFLKMNILEKTKSRADTTRFTLFKEGLFYKCYNEDAMVFAQKVKDNKVSSKYVKATVSNLVSIGFPASEVDKGKLSLEVIL